MYISDEERKEVNIMKKTYRIREYSPMYYIIKALPFIGLATILIIGGLINSYDIAHGIMPR